ncbi:MAG: hypothetical protein IJ285_06325 [Clostridia bacterium]|nr:hypothetical protein [Oscillospiraceae bacterium]MBQ7960816.1 hypothetical protein [Clostridia bacterium]
MANAISKFKRYIDTLDEVYKVASVTSVLDGNNRLVRMGANANEIIIPKMTMDGLADYSRENGYVSGDVTLTNETVVFNYERGRSFTVDAMDDEETAGVAFGQLSAEFVRTKAAPEIDAFRFAQYAGTEGITVVSKNITDASETLDALIAAQNAMDEAEVSAETRILFVTPTLYNGVMNIDTTKSKAVLDSFAQIVKVPQSRFFTAINLFDGSTDGETAGHFAKAENGADINFMIVEKSAAIQYQKHLVSKVVTPEENQVSDAWKFFYRSYGIADVYENKVSGIYLHHAEA